MQILYISSLDSIPTFQQILYVSPFEKHNALCMLNHVIGAMFSVSMLHFLQ